MLGPPGPSLGLDGDALAGSVSTCQTPAGRTSNEPCKLQTVKLLQVGALALCHPWQQGEKGLKQCSGSEVLCRRLLAVPWV